MSLKPEIWGKDGWKFLHYVSLGYPENPTNTQKEQYKNFYYSIKNVLPCHKCAQHYAENIQNFPLTDNILSDKNKLINWVIDVHNEVNKITNKPILNYDEARQAIGSINHNCNKSENNLLFIFIAILFGLITIAIIYKKKSI
jgi:hypothetical protein